MDSKKTSSKKTDAISPKPSFYHTITTRPKAKWSGIMTPRMTSQKNLAKFPKAANAKGPKLTGRSPLALPPS